MRIPRYTRDEIAADAVIHALGVGFALIGGPILLGLVAARGEAGPITAIAIYVASMIAMFSCSASYNLVSWPAAKEWLRRLDHSTIFLKIAGAYTPFAAISIGGTAGYSLLAAIWACALAGVVMKVLFPHRIETLSLALYLVMGWAAVAVAPEIAASVETLTLALLITAGALYSLGVIFHVWEGLKFQNAIWHLFVLTATAVLYAAIVIEFA